MVLPLLSECNHSPYLSISISPFCECLNLGYLPPAVFFQSGYGLKSLSECSSVNCCLTCSKASDIVCLYLLIFSPITQNKLRPNFLFFFSNRSLMFFLIFV